MFDISASTSNSGSTIDIVRIINDYLLLKLVQVACSKILFGGGNFFIDGVPDILQLYLYKDIKYKFIFRKG